MRIQCNIKKSVSNRGTRISCKKRTKTNAHFFVFLLGIFFFFHKSFYCHCFVFTSSLKQWDDCWCSLWKLLHNLHFNLKTNCLNCVSFTQSIYLFLYTFLPFSLILFFRWNFSIANTLEQYYHDWVHFKWENILLLPVLIMFIIINFIFTNW